MPNLCPTSWEARALPAVACLGRASESERELVALVRGAGAGNADAWRRLVKRFDPMLRQIARSFRLAPADVDDVVQMTWLNLIDAIDQVREPVAISGWLATVTRRHALRRIQAHVREQLTDDPELGDRPDDNQPESSLLAVERRAILATAIAKLPERQRVLMMVLLTQPTLEYGEISELLCMPIGSIGPIRARSLARLAGDAELCALNDPAIVA